jgi:hypothetical protein
MANESHRRLSDHAAQRHGVFTRAEATVLGVSDRSIDSRSADGRYERLEPGVYSVGGAPDTIMRRIAAAVASFPGLSAASHQTAAELWGLTNRGIKQIEVVTTRWDRVHRDTVRVHESLDLLPIDVVEHHGIPTTSPVRTVVDLGASNKWLVESGLENGIRQGLYTLDHVAAFVARVGKRGRRGVGVIRPLIEDRRRWDDVTESVLEDLFRKTVTAAGLPDPQPQYILRDTYGEFVCRADFAYPDARILIELDSEKHHLDRMTFRLDRAKQNRAALLGWTVLRYTWWDITKEPGRIWAEVNAALQRAHPERTCVPDRKLGG